MTSRSTEVAPERLAGWLERFGTSHGPVRVTAAAAEHLELAADDGSRAWLSTLWAPPGPPPQVPPVPTGAGSRDLVAELAARAAAPRTVLLVLVRRGGWGVGTAREGTLVEAATGTRYVQSRTAAGGWSQQRYARRRAGQAAALVAAAADRLVALLAAGAVRPDAVAVGGDRALVTAVLDDPRLRRAGALPRSVLLEVADPRRRVLAEAAVRVRCVRVRVDDPDPAAAARHDRSRPLDDPMTTHPDGRMSRT